MPVVDSATEPTCAPLPENAICRGCGISSPGDQHVRSPKCAFCGGPHPTADRTCRQRFEVPYIVRQRRRERRNFDKDFPPIDELYQLANKSKSRSSRGRSRNRSRTRSRCRSRSRSCSRSRGPAVSIQVPPATATEWADRVKGSQKQVTGGMPPEQNNDKIIQLERENAALKEAIAQFRAEMVALRNANNAKSEVSQPPQVTRVETPMEVPMEAPCTVRPAKKRALTKDAHDEGLESFKTEIRDMFRSLSETVTIVNVKVDSLTDKFNALDAKVNALDANFCALDAKVNALEMRKHDDVLEHFSGHLCQVVTVTEAEINAPWNSYNSCEVRKLYTAADDPRIVDRIPSPGTYPKHGRVTFAAHDDKSIGCFKPHGPVGERFVEVYLGLNNTLVEMCNYGETDSLLLERRADFIITPTNFAPSTSYYQHAVYPPMSVCFLTRQGQPVRPSFASTWLTFFSVSLMLVPLAAVLFFCLRMRVHRSQGKHNALDWASFFMATYVAQSPLLPTSSPSVAVRFTIAAWMFGMFFLIQFTQTEITASKSVQAFSFEIRHTADLTSRLDAGMIRPCMLHTLINLFDKYTDESSHLKSIHDANKKCVSGCLSTLFSDCILQAQRGTHAFIHYCRPFLIEGNMPSGLVMGDDRLVTNLLWEPLHRKNPLRHQHRRFMLAMEESGLTMQSLRPLLPWIRNTSGPVPFDMPLTDYAAVYVTGCCLSLLAFFAELLFARRAVHKAPSFRDQISSIDRPLGRSEDTPSDCPSTP
ncbi:hypothetical protein MTO96_043074 [Rhipicephalus appendiculatus]